MPAPTHLWHQQGIEPLLGCLSIHCTSFPAHHGFWKRKMQSRREEAVICHVRWSKKNSGCTSVLYLGPRALATQPRNRRISRSLALLNLLRLSALFVSYESLPCSASCNVRCPSCSKQEVSSAVEVSEFHQWGRKECTVPEQCDIKSTWKNKRFLIFRVRTVNGFMGNFLLFMTLEVICFTF